MAIGLDPLLNSEFPACIACLHGKQTRTSFPSDGGHRATQPLALIHSDVCGPISTATNSGFKYFITFIDDFSRYTQIYLLQYKHEVFARFQEFVTYVEKQTDQKVKILRSDNGGE